MTTHVPGQPRTMTGGERAVWRDHVRRTAEYVVTQAHVRAADVAQAVGIPQHLAIEVLRHLETHGVVTEPAGVDARRAVRVNRVPRSIPSTWRLDAGTL